MLGDSHTTHTVFTRHGPIYVDDPPRLPGVRVDLAEFSYEEGFFVLTSEEAVALAQALLARAEQ
jgi:hypothetical protein